MYLGRKIANKSYAFVAVNAAYFLRKYEPLENFSSSLIDSQSQLPLPLVVSEYIIESAKLEHSATDLSRSPIAMDLSAPPVGESHYEGGQRDQ